MPAKIGDEYLRLLIKRGLIPPTAISATIELKWGEVPVMTVETMPDNDELEYMLEVIKDTELLVPLDVAKPRISAGENG